jgi:hypothetical protein
MIGDILQYLTIPEVDKIIDNGELVYKTFIVNDRQTQDGKKSRKINFDLNMPKEMDDDEYLEASYDVLEEQGGNESKVELFRANPTLFRNLKYKCAVVADTLNPMSDDLERAFGLESFDKSIQAAQVGVSVDLEATYKDFILNNYPKSKDDPDKYIKKQELGVPQIPGMPQIPQMNQKQMNPVAPGPAESPLAAAIKSPMIGK